MFKHLLVPTDGSRLSAKAMRTAARLAKTTRARITGLYVMAPYVPPMVGEAAVYVPEVTPKRYMAYVKKEADKALAALEKEAKGAKVGVKTVAITDPDVWKGIIRTARRNKCDVIVMASHGRRGLAGLLIGSETTKVLTHSKIPVLVCR